MNAGDINLDDLQREIAAAELYLRKQQGQHVDESDLNNIPSTETVGTAAEADRNLIGEKDNYNLIFSVEDASIDFGQSSTGIHADSPQRFCEKRAGDTLYFASDLAVHDLCSVEGGHYDNKSINLTAPSSSFARRLSESSSYSESSMPRPSSAPNNRITRRSDIDDDILTETVRARHDNFPFEEPSSAMRKGIGVKMSRDDPDLRNTIGNRRSSRTVLEARNETENQDKRRGRSNNSRAGPPERLLRPKPQWRYLKSREDVEREASILFNQEFTFKPYLIEGFENDGEGRIEIESSEYRRSKSPYACNRPTDVVARIEQMQLNHERALREREKQKRDLERSELGQCTFRPQISKGTEHIMRSKTQLKSVNDNVNLGNHPERLSQTRSQSASGSGASRGITSKDSNVNSRYTADNRSRDVSRGKGGDTAPVSESGRCTSAGGLSSRGEDTSQRLHEEAFTRAEQQKWLEKRVLQDRLQECTFRPVLNATTSAIAGYLGNQPIHQRLTAMQRAKNEHMHFLRASLEEAERLEAPFQPNIDPHSRKLAERKQSAGLVTQGNRAVDIPDSADGEEDSPTEILRLSRDVGTRLLQNAKELTRRKQQLVHQREEEISREFTQVRVSKGSRLIARSNPNVGLSFEGRQALYSQQVKNKALARKLEDEAKGRRWFSPELTEKSEAILAKKR